MNALFEKTVEILNSASGLSRQIVGNIGGRPGGLDPAQARAAGLLGGLGGISKKIANTLGGVCFDQMFKALLGGTGPLGNILGGNGGPGLLAKLSKQIELKGSFVGTDEAGAPGFGNIGDGVRLEDSEQNLFDGNTLSGNNLVGMRMLGILSKLNTMSRNLVGMIRKLSDGLLLPLPNLQGGILLDTAPDNDIGLPVVARGAEGGAATAVGFNVISGNTGPGVTVSGVNAIRNALQSNFIGTNEAGTGVFGNSSHGVFFTAGARLNVVGGPGAGTGNVIAFNGGSGVSLDATAGDGNLVDPNAIYGNAALGIDLNNDGIRTPNDPGDADGGPNKLQNYPEIVSARLELNGDVVVQYKVDSAPANSDYGATGLLVEFFQSDPGQEGKKFLGNDRYTAAEFAAGSPGIGQARLVNARGLGVTGYDSVVGSATDNDNNTSEFSLGIPVVVSVGINDVKVAEGNSGTTAATFRVSLAAKDDEEITVDWVTANGSASAPGDYTSASGVLTFPPDTTVQNLTVQVKGDGGNEANETFVVNLTDATGAVIGDSQGVGTVLNDDGAVTNSIAPTSGPASGGTDVTLTGANYVAGAGVEFGSAAATGVSVNGATQIEATSPALTPGTLNDVVVTNPDGFAGTLLNGWLADFLDVPDAHSFHDFVERLFRSAITSGCGGGNYCPDASVTRGQMAVFLLKGKNGTGYLPPPASGTVFSDVPLGSFAADWIEQLAEDGITSGCGAGKYCPNNPVTREQMAVFLLRAKHGSSYVPPPATGDFTDVPITSVFAPWIEQLFAEGITSGCGPGKYCPTSPNTRGQMAVFLVRTFALP
jgi:parallel beta-helix repeat protein